MIRLSYASTRQASLEGTEYEKTPPSFWQPPISTKLKWNCYPKHHWQKDIASNPTVKVPQLVLKPSNLLNHSALAKELKPPGRKFSSPFLTAKVRKSCLSAWTAREWKPLNRETSKSSWICSKKRYPLNQSLSSTVKQRSPRSGSPSLNFARNPVRKNHLAR